MKNKVGLAEQKLILTFGYGNRKNYDQFLEYLKEYNVHFVIDVRSKPRAWSRKWYGDQIYKFCNLNNIQYISKTELGNESGNKNWIPPNKNEANLALQEVAKLAEEGTVLLLCAEMNHHRCHRLDVANHLKQLIPNNSIKHLE